MDSEKFKQVLHRYLNGTASDAEKEAVDAWYDTYRELEDAEVFGNDAEASRIASEMREQVSGHWAPPRRFGVRKYLAYAAALLVLVGVSLMVYRWQGGHNQVTPHQMPTAAEVNYQEIATSIRQVKKIVLPDSSTVWVNALSQLRIPESFGTKSRELFLDEGEAFFEVARNPDKPFVVHSRGIATEVLGTAFNISNYQRLNRIAVDVQHGKVRETDDHEQLLAGELTAAQQLTYHPLTGEVDVATHATRHAAAWREGIIGLRDASFEEVALALYAIHGVELKAASDQIRHHRYSLVVRSLHSLDETLRIICSIHQNQYRRENDDVIIY